MSERRGRLKIAYANFQTPSAHLSESVHRAQDPSFALLHVARTPGPIKAMQRSQSFLHIRARAGLFRARDHAPDLSRIGVGGLSARCRSASSASLQTADFFACYSLWTTFRSVVVAGRLLLTASGIICRKMWRYEARKSGLSAAMKIGLCVILRQAI